MEKHWLKQYDEGVPHSLQPYPERTLLDVVSETACQRPEHPALLFKGACLSYGALERLSEKALKRANIADDRKEQLDRAWKLHKKRQLELERTKERGRPFGLDLDLFDT